MLFTMIVTKISSHFTTVNDKMVFSISKSRSSLYSVVGKYEVTGEIIPTSNLAQLDSSQ